MTPASRIETLFGEDALRGCVDPQTAEERASALLQGTSAGPGAGYWEAAAGQLLRCYLLAAALCDAGAQSITDWARDPGDPSPSRVLREHPDRVPADWPDQFDAFFRFTPEPERAMTLHTLLHALRQAREPESQPRGEEHQRA